MMFETLLPVASDFILIRRAWSLREKARQFMRQRCTWFFLLVNDCIPGNHNASYCNIRGDGTLTMLCKLRKEVQRILEKYTMEIPWPPMQVLSEKVIFEPLFMAKQSSWLRMVLYEQDKMESLI